jgi:pimeloyl-ACP methyl ester carboxylesterase
VVFERRNDHDLTRAGEIVVVPSLKYHLPRLEEPFRVEEYRYTTERLATAWAGPKEIHLLEGAGHNDIQAHPEYYARINGFLDGLR